MRRILSPILSSLFLGLSACYTAYASSAAIEIEKSEENCISNLVQYLNLNEGTDNKYNNTDAFSLLFSLNADLLKKVIKFVDLHDLKSLKDSNKYFKAQIISFKILIKEEIERLGKAHVISTLHNYIENQKNIICPNNSEIENILYNYYSLFKLLHPSTNINDLNSFEMLSSKDKNIAIRAGNDYISDFSNFFKTQFK